MLRLELTSGAAIEVSPFEITIRNGMVRIYKYPQEFENRINGQVLLKTVRVNEVGRVPSMSGLYRITECATKINMLGNEIITDTGFAHHIRICGKMVRSFINMDDAIDSEWPGRLGERDRQRAAVLAALPIR